MMGSGLPAVTGIMKEYQLGQQIKYMDPTTSLTKFGTIKKVEGGGQIVPIAGSYRALKAPA